MTVCTHSGGICVYIHDGRMHVHTCTTYALNRSKHICLKYCKHTSHTCVLPNEIGWVGRVHAGP